MLGTRESAHFSSNSILAAACCWFRLPGNSISISSVKLKEFTEEKQDVLFSRPSAKGYKNIYENVEGGWVEQRLN